MLLEKNIFPSEFKIWIIHDRENRITIFLSIIISLVIFTIFNKLYPFPNFLPDSYSYIEAAHRNININLWPIGYSKFLRFVSVFNHTDSGLFFIQYIILISSILFFILSIKYLLTPNKIAIRIITIILVINPLWLYVSNFVSSDALFATFSLLWLTTLFWLLYKPTVKLIILHSIILLIVFSVRYNALYYPLVSLLTIILGQKSPKFKVLSILIIFIPLAGFTTYTVLLYKEKTKTPIFSPFGGWQLAANAMYMYAHISPATKESVPPIFKDLHAITVKHLDSLNKLKPQNRPDNLLGIYYLWDEKAPLKNYLSKKKGRDSSSYILKYAQMAPLYGKYGTWLIKQYPIKFFEYYLLPNSINYYSPNTEFLGIYNMGSDSVDIGAVEWFKYKTRVVHGPSKNKKIYITEAFPIIIPLINILFLTGLIGLLFINRFKQILNYHRKIIVAVSFIWIINLLFSVLASPIVLRYQIFPFIFTFAFSTLFITDLIMEGFTVNVRKDWSNL